MLTAENTVIGLSFSLPAKGPFYEVELVGFQERELTLIRSVFKLSEMRTRHFRLWDPQSSTKPQIVMVDLDAGQHATTSATHLAQAFSGLLIGVGSHAPKADFPVKKFIERPVRWASVLAILDELFQNDGMGSSSNSDGWADKVPPEVISHAENQVEELQIEPRFDPAQTIAFQTEPGILVVDPDPRTAQTMRVLLANDGYRVDSATTAPQAYQLLATRRYNIVFTERFILGVDALEIAHTIKQREDRRTTTVVILTTHGSLSDRLKTQAAGCKAYWKKPIKEEKFHALVKKFIPNWVMKE
ncbi:MAG: response regulator [Burkholderiaceae bacterium]|nr:MAG: response regulator [Burkholderiaceae bacterium]